jgi:RimJ/RimL family protein N-acetyltransferase
MSPVIQSDRLTIRRTTDDDLDFVLATENADDNRGYIIPWPRRKHVEACSDSDMMHFICTDAGQHDRIGYGIIAGLNNPYHCIEFTRLVIIPKEQGFGREAIRLIATLAFEQWNAHRLWLDVKSNNPRARYLYASCGFKEEGTLRECIMSEAGYESLVVMSMLQTEHEGL